MVASYVYTYSNSLGSTGYFSQCWKDHKWHLVARGEVEGVGGSINIKCIQNYSMQSQGLTVHPVYKSREAPANTYVVKH